MAPLRARYGHTNIVATDWRRLASFYTEVFGCVPVPPERDISEEWMARLTGVPGARVRGVHLHLPGFGEHGPTLEIFQYERAAERVPAAVNRPGFAHIAFQVEEVAEARDRVVAAGGGVVGELVRTEIPGAGPLTVMYLTDPEGNIIEVQRWGG